MIDTKAAAPAARGAGSRSNFSISGKLMSVWERPDRRNSPSMSGNRCKVWGPNTRSTNGARARMPSPSWLATHPPTPMTTPGRSCFSSRHSPSSEYTFSSAFSRIEQVLTSKTSASPGLSVRVRPFAASSTSRIFAESYSFIWQPKVFMYRRPGIGSRGNGR
jgi:hypothetical protein